MPRHRAALLRFDLAKYQALLEPVCKYADQHPVEGEWLVLINVWNKWTEGTCLESECGFGYVCLDATRAAPRQRAEA